MCAGNLVVVFAELVTCRATFWTHGKSCRQALSLSTAAAAVAVALRDWLRAGTNIYTNTLYVFLKRLFNSRSCFYFPCSSCGNFRLVCRTCETAINACKFSLFSAILLAVPHCHSHYHCLQADTTFMAHSVSHLAAGKLPMRRLRKCFT